MSSLIERMVENIPNTCACMPLPDSHRKLTVPCVTLLKITPNQWFFMAFFNSSLFKAMVEPVLGRVAADRPDLAAVLKATGFQQTARVPLTRAKEDTMGALLKFLLINVASVIGAKLLNEATEYATTKLAQRKQATMDSKVEPSVKKAKKASDVPTLETRTCPKCGAFRVRGEPCTCG